MQRFLTFLKEVNDKAVQTDEVATTSASTQTWPTKACEKAAQNGLPESHFEDVMDSMHCLQRSIVFPFPHGGLELLCSDFPAAIDRHCEGFASCG